MTNVFEDAFAAKKPVKFTLDFSGVILPRKSPFDKIAALAVLSRHNRRDIESLRYYTANECSEEQFKAWDAERVYPIDIGHRKYHKAGAKSATAWLASRYLLPLSRGEQELLRLVNENNRTGNLKQGGDMRIAFLIRELYELDESDEWALEVIIECQNVILSYLDVEDGMAVRSADEPMDEALTHLAKKLAKDSEKPFSLGRYLRDLWLLGGSSEDIQRRVAFWRDNSQRLERERARAKGEFALMERNEFGIGDMKCLVLRTSDHFLAKAAARSKQYWARIIIADDGHVAISTEGLDVRGLAAELTQMEPERWYANNEMGALINGGPQYTSVEPTKFGAGMLIKLMRKHLRKPVHGDNKK